jgi:two-component system, cell cycle sensor histidine kinase and response regulator CckA
MTMKSNMPKRLGQSDAGGFSQGLAQHPAKTILVVEDETPIRRLLVSLLSAEGYRIQSVADGTLAIRILEDDPEIDLVLTDLAMPGIPGTAVAEYLSRTRPQVKVVCMSGDPQPHEKSLRRLLDRRLVDFLPKPFTPLQVLQMVKRLLEL